MRVYALLCAATALAGCNPVSKAHAAPARAAESCATCHTELTGKLHDPVAAFRGKDVHAAAGLTCSSCHAGNPGDEHARTAHSGNGFIARPASGEGVAAMCGKCHTEPATNWAKGPHHLANAPRRPDCTTCHGAHGVQRASVELIAEPLCSSCHTVAQARRIFKALNDSEKEVAALDAELAKSGNGAAERAALKQARSQLRGVTHALDLFTITRNAAETLKVVEQVRAKAEPKIAGKDWGKRLRMAALVLAALMGLAAAAWGARWLWARKHKLPVPKGRELMLVSGALGVFAIAAAIGGYKAHHYIEKDPKFCTSCHTMNTAYTLWEQSGHKNVDCHTCHLPDVASNLHQLWYYATRRPDEVIKHAEVDHGICEKCHSNGSSGSKFNHVADTPGHRVHVGKERIECIQCHSMSLHRFVPPKDACATCHKKVTLAAAGTMAEMHCLQCHPFMADDLKRPLKPDRAACLDCHEKRQIGSETFPVKAPMKWDCGKCHKPHEKLYIARNDCFGCHNTMTEGVHRMKGHQNCLDCHRPHGWNTTPANCTACHAKINPASHHADSGKSCKDCHGAWDDEFLPKAKVKTASK